MNRRTLLRLGLTAGALPLLGALTPQQMPQSWIPGHVQNNDPSWGVLNGAQVAIDEHRGTMTASFTDMIRHMDQHDLTIGGFLLPLDSRQQFTHFVLTRRNSSCPFCPPNLPTEAIEVFATTPLEYSPDEFLVSGRLQIATESTEGLFYRLNNAHVRVQPT